MVETLALEPFILLIIDDIIIESYFIFTDITKTAHASSQPKKVFCFPVKTFRECDYTPRPITAKMSNYY